MSGGWGQASVSENNGEGGLGRVWMDSLQVRRRLGSYPEPITVLPHALQMPAAQMTTRLIAWPARWAAGCAWAQLCDGGELRMRAHPSTACCRWEAGARLALRANIH